MIESREAIELQLQIIELKQAITEVQSTKQAIGPRGPAGPPGPFVAGPKGESITGATGAAGRDGRNGVDGQSPSKETLETAVVQILGEYHVIDPETGLPYAGPYAKK